MSRPITIMAIIFTVLVIIAVILRFETNNISTLAPSKIVSAQSGTQEISDEPAEYLVAVERTAIAGNMSMAQLRDKIRELSAYCRRPKLEVYRFIRHMARTTYDLKGSIAMTPAMCDEANSTDRDLIKPGPL